MDSFRTEIKVPPVNRKIGLKTPLLCIGSCFAKIIGRRLVHNKFNALVNPFGTLFNPVSVCQNLLHAWENSLLSENNILHREGRFFHFDFHSGFGAANKEILHQNIEQAFHQTHAQLKKSQWIIITLGTAFVYQRKENGSIVANCHKMPQSWFEKKRLSPGEIIPPFASFFNKILQNNPHVQCILTVSPVRHIKDGLTNNSVSKATLRLACEQLKERYPENISYFPSYEILMDDLRDYRFYHDDMIHPSKVAEDYIWKKFVETYCDDESIQFIKAWEQISKALEHRPFYAESEAHQQFLQNTIAKISEWENKVDVSAELDQLKKQLL